jgi:magnesium transporter
MDGHSQLKEVRLLIAQKQINPATQLVESIPPPDQVNIITHLDLAEKKALFTHLSPRSAAHILERLNNPEASDIARHIDPRQLIKIVERMEPDEAADLLGDLEPQRCREILEGLENRSEIEPLLAYPDDTAGGRMTSRYLTFSPGSSTAEIMDAIRSVDRVKLKVPYIFIVDDQGVLQGVVSAIDLIRADPEDPVSDYMQTDLQTIKAQDDQEDAARLMAHYDLPALPVTDDNSQLVGAITLDDAIRTLEEETTEDIFNKAAIGSSGEKDTDRSHTLIKGKIVKVWLVRLPFLLITMVGGLAAGLVIDSFEEAMQAVTALAIFIPVVMDMGGNSGTQSSTIFVRGLALGQINPGRFWHHLSREALIGLGMGAILGIIVGVIAALWQGIPEIGLVVGLSLWAAIALATTLGFLIPFILIKLGLDQAAGADPVITTIKDITGLLIYFGLANLFLRQLIN